MEHQNADTIGHASTVKLPFQEPTIGQRLGGGIIDALVALTTFAMASLAVDGQLRALLALVAVAVYQITLTATTGQTVGKMLMSTRVTDYESGLLPTWFQATKRWLAVIIVSLVSLVIPDLETIEALWTLAVLIPILSSPLHRGLHDFAAGTIVTSEPIGPSPEDTTPTAD